MTGKIPIHRVHGPLVSMSRWHVNLAAEGGTTLSMLVIPWEVVGDNGWARWKFAKGSVTWDADHLSRVKLVSSHDTYQLESLLGSAVSITSADDGLRAEFAVSDSAGLEYIRTLVKEGHLDGVSAGLTLGDDAAIESLDDGTQYVTAGAVLREVSLVTIPAFDSARLDKPGEPAEADPAPAAEEPAADTANSAEDTEPAPADDGTTDDEQPKAAAENTDDTDPTEDYPDTEAEPDADPTDPDTAPEYDEEDDKDKVANSSGENIRMSNTNTPATAPRPVAKVTEPATYQFNGKGRSLVRDMYLARYRNDAEAAAHVDRFHLQLQEGHQAQTFAMGTTSGLASIIPTVHRDDMFAAYPTLNTPLWDAVSKAPIEDATPFNVPLITAATGLAINHTQGTNPAGGDITVAARLVGPVPISGVYEMSRELAEAASPAMDQIVLAEMARSYVERREANIAALLQAIPAAQLGTGAQVSVTGSGALLVDAVRAQILASKFRVGANPITVGVLEDDAFIACANAKDTMGRDLLSAYSPVNASGSSDRFNDALEVKGRPITGSAVLTTSHLFAEGSVYAFTSAIREFRFEEQSGPAVIKLAHFSYFAGAVIRPTDVVRLAYTAA